MLTSRKYKPGDETQINALYKLLTGRERDVIQYSWEWLDNPYKKESIWVIEEDSERIVGHHGLIPTPMNVLNKSVLAGKTENTMMHPEYRGKRAYFPFEKKFIKEAEKIYQLLFTTTGKGAPGRIREKLGYQLIGYWDIYRCYFSFKRMKTSKSNKNQTKLQFIVQQKLLSSICAILKIYNFFGNIKYQSKKIKFELNINKNESNIIENIENLWLDNKQYYANTIDRKKQYLNWRINKNPYHTHIFITLKKNNEFLGYIIALIRDGKNVEIVDIFVKKNEPIYFKILINECASWAKNTGLEYVECSVIGKNMSLQKALLQNSFINIGRYIKQPFYLKYLDKLKLQDEKMIYDPSKWYITGLVFEGR